MEAMVAVVVMGILLSISAKTSFKPFEPSYREAPVILMGCLNDERREVQENISFNQVKVEEGKITQWNEKRRLKKTVFLEDNMVIEFEGKKELSFLVENGFSFRVITGLNRSGRINFIRNGKYECYLMIHLGSSTMDLRLN